MQLNKATLKQVRNKVQSQLDELDLAVKFELGHCTYDTDGQYATFKLNVLVEGGKSKEQKDLEWYAKMNGLDLDKAWKEGTHIFKLHGYKTRARKNPYIIRDTLTNKEYVISEQVAERHFKVEKQSEVGNLTLVQ